MFLVLLKFLAKAKYDEESKMSRKLLQFENFKQPVSLMHFSKLKNIIQKAFKLVEM